MTTDHDPRFDDARFEELRVEMASMQEAVRALAVDNAELRARLDRPASVPTVGGLFGRSPAVGSSPASPSMPSMPSTPSTPSMPAMPAPVVSTARGSSTDSDAVGRPADRRAFLRGGALAASVLAAGAAASVAGASPAAAANGDSLVLGDSENNEATLPTGINVDLSGMTGTDPRIGFVVADGPPNRSQIAPAAIFGHAEGTTLRVGVQGMTDGEEAAGVYGVGLEHQSVGVWGNGNEAGVFAQGMKTAITAESSEGIGLDVSGTTAVARLRTRVITPDFATEFHFAGELISAEVGPFGAALFFCVEGGTPGTWRQLASPLLGGSLVLLPVTTRVYDSRAGNPPATGLKTKLTGANSPRTITLSNEDLGVDPPFTPTAILVNLTVVNTSAGGFVALHQGGTTWPGNSNINWTAANTVIANAATVALDAQNRFAITCANGASTDIIVDLIGVYF